PLLQSAILKMDRWITAIKADKRHIRQIDKVVQNKPADLQEGRYTNTKDTPPTFIPEHQVRDPSTCHDLYPSNSFPREVAEADAAVASGAMLSRAEREEDHDEDKHGHRRPPPNDARDTVLINGKIHTMDDGNTVGSAMSIKVGRVAEVGNASRARHGHNTRV